jgi:hypothetical protein
MCSQSDDPTQYDRAGGDEVPDSPGDNGARGVRSAVAEEVEAPPTTAPPPTRIPFTSPDRTGAYLFLPTADLQSLNGLLKDLQVIDRFFGNENTITPVWRLNLHIMVTDALLKLNEG